MDHVIADLRRWLDVYESDPPGERDERAIARIKAAIEELSRYYNN